MRFFIFIIASLSNICLLAQSDTSSVKIMVASTNLSEDLSVASSKNDELLLLIYEFSEKVDKLGEPVFIKSFDFREDRMNAIFDWTILKSKKENYLFFLIERDSDKSELQVDPVLRIHSESIIECFDNRDYLCIEKYLGDEDLLGYKRFSVPSEHELNGVYKLDRFNYTITFQE
ncbi:MAG: hypothetical protein ABJG47_06130 [Ekhidna sp.]